MEHRVDSTKLNYPWTIKLWTKIFLLFFSSYTNTDHTIIRNAQRNNNDLTQPSSCSFYNFELYSENVCLLFISISKYVWVFYFIMVLVIFIYYKFIYLPVDGSKKVFFLFFFNHIQQKIVILLLLRFYIIPLKCVL